MTMIIQTVATVLHIRRIHSVHLNLICALSAGTFRSFSEDTFYFESQFRSRDVLQRRHRRIDFFDLGVMASPWERHLSTAEHLTAIVAAPLAALPQRSV